MTELPSLLDLNDPKVLWGTVGLSVFATILQFIFPPTFENSNLQKIITSRFPIPNLISPFHSPFFRDQEQETHCICDWNHSSFCPSRVLSFLVTFPPFSILFFKSRNIISVYLFYPKGNHVTRLPVASPSTPHTQGPETSSMRSSPTLSLPFSASSVSPFSAPSAAY